MMNKKKREIEDKKSEIRRKVLLQHIDMNKVEQDWANYEELCGEEAQERKAKKKSGNRTTYRRSSRHGKPKDI